MRPKGKVIVLSALLLLFVCTLGLHFANNARLLSRAIPLDSGATISSIYILSNQDGEEKEFTLTGEQLSRIEAELLRCIGEHSMTMLPISLPSSLPLPDPYLYISVWIHSEDDSFRVNVSNVESHSAVQFGDKHFGLCNSSQLLSDLQALPGWAWSSLSK